MQACGNVGVTIANKGLKVAGPHWGHSLAMFVLGGALNYANSLGQNTLHSHQTG